MSQLNIEINDIKLQVPEGTTVLEAAKTLNIHIPTLCHLDLHDLKAVNQVASCRVCLVHVEGRPNLMPSCATKCTEGMVIKTNTKEAILARRTMVELLLSDHPKDCLNCEKNLSCDLQQLAADLGIRSIKKFEGVHSSYPEDTSSRSIRRNPDKCIMCRRCETMCNEVQTCGILSAVDRGFNTVVQPAFSLPMNETMCTFCGQCVAVCPTAALTEMSNISHVWDSIQDESKHVIVQTAPAVRVALGEEFGYPSGSIVTGQMVAALRRMGFDKVFDTDFAADLTIMEEAAEIVHRIENNGTLPILTSCCPAWVKFFEHQYPDLLDIPSTCKSPHEMFGAIAKTYYAEKIGVDPKDIVVVSIMPCVAKKYEAAREELSNDGMLDVDYVVTTRELALMIKEAGLDFKSLPEEDFDHPLGESTGAGVIFGTTGGVIEAALRTAYEWITNETLVDVEFKPLRGFDGIRETKLVLGDTTFNIGVAHGLGNARKLLDAIRAGEVNFHAIEIMACPGGCIGGGGQPYHHGNPEVLRQRGASLYNIDGEKKLRKSHENPDIIKLYDEFLGKPNGELSHKLLHTKYVARDLI